MATVAFIGLGTMGFAMAGHLACEGHQVTVYNRTAGKSELWCDEFGGDSAASPREAVVGAELVFTCVGNDEHLRAVLLGEEGAFAGMAPGSVLIDHTTTSGDITREIAALAATREIGFLDAPLTGGQAGAEAGMLTVKVGGNAALFERAAPVIESYAKSVELVGPVGGG
jgi:3-hydroxyisobutyrate dehydrogenase